jgi:glucokinase
MQYNYYLGIDIGGTKCAVIAGTQEMEILDRIQFDNQTEKGPDHTISALLKASNDLILKFPDLRLAAIGISCGGPLDSRAGIIQSPPNLPGWDNIGIVKIFRKRYHVPVFLQNDANACALAEWRFGAGKGTRNMIFLTFGTGLGAGLILDGRIYTGTNDLAGEVGHIRMAEEGPEAYGKKGSFEAFCSGSGISSLAKMYIREKLKNGEKVTLCKGNQELEKLTTKDLAEAAAMGDLNAMEIFEISGRYLGKGLSILIDVLNPQRIVIGSVYARNPHLFKSIAEEIIQREALAPAWAVCEIVPAALGDQVGDYASLSVAMQGNGSLNGDP